MGWGEVGSERTLGEARARAHVQGGQQCRPNLPARSGCRCAPRSARFNRAASQPHQKEATDEE